MLFLTLLLCTTAAAQSSNIPLIDGIERSGFFNYKRQEFESRRLFVNIVDTVSFDANSPGGQVILPLTNATVIDDPAALLPTAVAIGLEPSEKHPEYYGFVSRKIAEALRCVDATDAEFERDASIPEYILTVDESNTLVINRYDENSGDADTLLRRVAMLAGMTENEADKIELTDCWYMRSPEVMRINVAAGGEPMIRSGWIVERYPLGKFYKKAEHYRRPAFLTNYSYIDGFSGSIIDVFASTTANGKRVWTPTGWPAFARTKMEHVPVQNVGKANNFTIFRETATGVLITTLAQSMSLSYQIERDVFEERIALDGNHYHVSCDMRATEMIVPASLLDQLKQHTLTSIEITLNAPDGSSSFSCKPKRATPTGVPEVLQLDYVEQSGGRSIPSSDREVTVRKANARREDATTNEQATTHSKSLLELAFEEDRLGDEVVAQVDLDRFYGPNKHVGQESDAQETPVKPEQAPAFVNVAREKEESLSALALMIFIVSMLALTTVTCALACARNCILRRRESGAKSSVSDKTGEGRRRKNGHQDLAQSTLKPKEATTENMDENEELKPSLVPTRSNSGKKKSITFAPRKSSMRTEDLVKMIAESELGPKIDAMVEAGPDGEEELLPVQQGTTAGAAAEVIDETTPAPKEEKTEKSE